MERGAVTASTPGPGGPGPAESQGPTNILSQCLIVIEPGQSKASLIYKKADGGRGEGEGD